MKKILAAVLVVLIIMPSLALVTQHTVAAVPSKPLTQQPLTAATKASFFFDIRGSPAVVSLVGLSLIAMVAAIGVAATGSIKRSLGLSLENCSSLLPQDRSDASSMPQKLEATKQTLPTTTVLSTSA